MGSNPFTLGLECSSACHPTGSGIAHFITEFTAAILARNAAHPFCDPALYYKFSRWKRRHYRLPADAAPARWHGFPLDPFRAPVDIFHSLDSRRYNRLGRRQIVTVYDVAVLKDETQVEGYTTAAFRERRRSRMREIIASDDYIMTISQTTRADIVEMFDCDPDRIAVVLPGLNRHFLDDDADPAATTRVLARHGLDQGGYLLYLGTISVRKNIPRLLAAYARANARQEYPLVLAGPKTDETDAVFGDIDRLGLGHAVHYLGYVADNELPTLYAGATAFLFPTLYEGFGIPIIEAMACGTPVLAGDRGAAPEVAGEQAILCDPHQVESIAAGIDRVVERPRIDLERARRYARGYTWERAAKQAETIYRAVLGASR